MKLERVQFRHDVTVELGDGAKSGFNLNPALDKYEKPKYDAELGVYDGVPAIKVVFDGGHTGVHTTYVPLSSVAQFWELRERGPKPAPAAPEPEPELPELPPELTPTPPQKAVGNVKRVREVE